MVPWLAFIESNTSGTGRLFARAATEQGFRPILLAADPSRYAYAVEDGLDTLRVDTQDEASLLRECRRLAHAPALAGVASSSEYFIASAASLARRLHLPGADADALLACRDKLKQRLRLRSAGIGIPAFREATSVGVAVEGATHIGFPVVVKTASGSGSIDVRLCRDSEEVAAHAAKLLGQRHNERGMPLPGHILIEEFVEGPEYSVETFNQSVIGITQKYLGSPPFFVEVGHDYPATLPADIVDAMREAALRALDALGLGWGPAHIELRLTEEGVRIIEINPRLAGGFIPELVRLSSGINLITETIRASVGRAPELQRSRHAYALIRFFLPAQEGILEHVEGLEEAAAMPCVLDVQSYRPPGGEVRLRGDFRDRIGHIIASDDSPALAREAVESSLKKIRIVIRPD